MRRSLLTIAFCFVVFSCAIAGTNGTVGGIVRDAKTKEPLPGVNVVLVELQTGISTDTSGRYVLRNIRSGYYNLRFTHVGYAPHVIRNVLVDPDRKIVLNVDLQPSEVSVGEIIVTQERPLIRQDVTGSTYFLQGSDVRLLPIQNVTDMLGLQPGVTLEGNVRGGKTTDVAYLVDGLPVQDLMAGGVASTLPASSVFGMTV